MLNIYLLIYNLFMYIMDLKPFLNNFFIINFVNICYPDLLLNIDKQTMHQARHLNI